MMLSHVQLFVTPWIIQPMEFSRPPHWLLRGALLAPLNPVTSSLASGNSPTPTYTLYLHMPVYTLAVSCLLLKCFITGR